MMGSLLCPADLDQKTPGISAELWSLLYPADCGMRQRVPTNRWAAMKTVSKRPDGQRPVTRETGAMDYGIRYRAEPGPNRAAAGRLQYEGCGR